MREAERERELEARKASGEGKVSKGETKKEATKQTKQKRIL